MMQKHMKRRALALMMALLALSIPTLAEDAFTHPHPDLAGFYLVSDMLDPTLHDARDTQLMADLAQAAEAQHNLYDIPADDAAMPWDEALKMAVDAIQAAYGLTDEDIARMSVDFDYQAQTADNPFWRVQLVPTDPDDAEGLDHYTFYVYTESGKTEGPYSSADAAG